MVTLETNTLAFARESFARLSTRLSRRFSQRNRDYNYINDTQDTRLPLHNEDAFSHGIGFKCKFIGSLEITKPSSKLDIIAAMRRIRYEFKVKGIRKVRCYLHVSVDGAKVTKRKSKRKSKSYTDEQLFIMQHPVYRIFYVAHDSQDLNIFCYITREVPSNTFRCNVFKSAKRNQALHIVRTVGQAFDVCHKSNPKPQFKRPEKAGDHEGDEKSPPNEMSVDDAIEKASGEKDATTVSPSNTSDPDAAVAATTKKEEQPEAVQADNLNDLMQFNRDEKIPNGTSDTNLDPLFAPGNSQAASVPDHNRESVIEENLFADDSRKGVGSTSVGVGEFLSGASNGGTSVSVPAMWEFEKKQMSAQITLLNTQLQAETSSRIEAQAQVQHLLSQNKQLLNHVQQLTTQLQKIQELQQQTTHEAVSPQNSNSNNNNIKPLVISDNSDTTSSSKSDSPDFQATTDQPLANDSPQATNPLFEYPSDEMTVEPQLLPGDPFLVDPFSSSNGITVDTAGGDSS